MHNAQVARFCGIARANPILGRPNYCITLCRQSFLGCQRLAGRAKKASKATREDMYMYMHMNVHGFLRNI